MELIRLLLGLVLFAAQAIKRVHSARNAENAVVNLGNSSLARGLSPGFLFFGLFASFSLFFLIAFASMLDAPEIIPLSGKG